MNVCTHTHTQGLSHRDIPTQQCGQRPHVLLHQRVDLLLGEAPDAVAVHLPAHHAAVQVAQQPLQSVAQRAAHRQQLLRFLQVVHPLTVGYCPDRNTHSRRRFIAGLRAEMALLTNLTPTVCQEWRHAKT